MSENGNNNNGNGNAELLLILNQLREQVAILAADVHELKNGNNTEAENDEDNRSVRSHAQDPPDNFRQEMEQFMKRVKSSPAFKDSYPHYDDYIPASKGKVPVKFSLPEYLKFTGLEDPHHHVKGFLNIMAAKGLDKEAFHLVFPWSFSPEVTQWYHSLDPQKTNSWEELCREFLNQYSCNTEAPFTIRDLELYKQEENETFSTFLLRWKMKAAHMANRPVEADQVAMVIDGLRPKYRQYLQFANISTFADLKRMGMKVDKEIAAEKHNSNTHWKSNYPPKSTKANGSSSHGATNGAEVAALSSYKKYTQYTPIAISYTEALERLLEKDLIKLPEIKPEPEVKSKSWDAAKYCKYHRARGHDTESCWVFKDKLEDQFQAGKLPVPVKKAH